MVVLRHNDRPAHLRQGDLCVVVPLAARVPTRAAGTGTAAAMSVAAWPIGLRCASQAVDGGGLRGADRRRGRWDELQSSPIIISTILQQQHGHAYL
jgi:hypothetical protein